MSTQKGYQIVEVEQIQSLVIYAQYQPVAIAILSWLCEMLRKELPQHNEYVDYEVICVTYLGRYPAIGIYYKDKTYADISSSVERQIDLTLKSSCALDMILYLGRDQINWVEKKNQLLGI